MDKELIKEILSYIEHVEEQIDSEWGDCRSFEELLEEKENLREFYFKIMEVYKETSKRIY